eukprot:2287019-Pleurochrysis_carterae.AAC.1
MLDSPDSKRRECEGELRRRRDANMTLAEVEGGAETLCRGAAKRASSSSRRAGTVGCGKAERTLASASPSRRAGTVECGEAERTLASASPSVAAAA